MTVMETFKTLYKVDSKGKVRVFSMECSGASYSMITGLLDGKKVTSKPTVAKAKNVGRANETTPEQQARLEIAARYTKKTAEGYFATVQEALDNPDGLFFSPMLATEIEKVKEKDRPYPYIVDPKLDGMRMTANVKDYLSRKGKPIPTAAHIWKALEVIRETYPTITLDGELYNHSYKDNFNDLMSLARKTKPTEQELLDAEGSLEYHVYDLYDSNNPDMIAIDRKQLLDQIFEEISVPCVHVVDYVVVFDDEQLEKVKALNVENGYEGSIVRLYDSVYVNKRAKHLMKLKTFFTAEFEILDILPGKGTRGDIAGTVVVAKGDVVVGCGIKGSHQYCANLLDKKSEYIGLQATIKYFEETPDGSLRFPVCIDINRPD